MPIDLESLNKLWQEQIKKLDKEQAQEEVATTSYNVAALKGGQYYDILSYLKAEFEKDKAYKLMGGKLKVPTFKANILSSLSKPTTTMTKEQKLANVYKTSSDLAQSISETLATAGVSLEVAIAALMQLLVAGAFEFERITKNKDAFEKMYEDMKKMKASLEKKKDKKTGK